MTESQRIADQLRRAFDGDTWTGRSIHSIVAAVSPASAAAHPIAGAHSAWELLLHLGAWLTVTQTRIAGNAVDPTEEENFPAVTDTSERAWRETWTNVEREYLALAETIERLPDSRLEEAVPGRSYSGYHQLHGVIQHSLYHAGQIALLAKA